MSREVCITGIGLLSGLGHSAKDHWDALENRAALPRTSSGRFAPYVVHPLGEVDFAQQIPKKSDLRQMEAWQRIGVYASGLALDDAGLKGNRALLERMHLIVAAGSGERDTSTDMLVLDAIARCSDAEIRASEILPSNLRPTLFLAQLSNLLAGNISIVHNVTGSSRTFLGEEMAGIGAVENAVRRIQAEQGDLFLVGGAFNAEREDALLNFELGLQLSREAHYPVWERGAHGLPGFCPASIGAFLVVEERRHALARGARIYAQITDVVSGRCNRQSQSLESGLLGLLKAIAPVGQAGPVGILSGASGAEPGTQTELKCLKGLAPEWSPKAFRAYGSILGHGVEAHFPAGVALAALALHHGRFYPPFCRSPQEEEIAAPPAWCLVTACGHWRGEGLAVLTPARE